MSLAIAQALGMTPRTTKARGRLVFNLTGDLSALRGRNKTSAQVRREREMIYACIEARGNPTRDEIATDTGIDPETVIDGDRMRMLSVEECRRAMGFPDDYKLPHRQKDAMHMLGNAVCPPVARDVINALREAA